MNGRDLCEHCGHDHEDALTLAAIHDDPDWIPNVKKETVRHVIEALYMACDDQATEDTLTELLCSIGRSQEGG